MAVHAACQRYLSDQLRDATNGDRHDVLSDGSHPPPTEYRAYRQSVDARLVQILRQHPERCFLEIGVGPTFRQEGFRAINDLGINFVGLDFEHVCAERRADLAAAGIADRNIAFLGNPSGTYLFNLISWRGIERLSTSSISMVAIRSMSIRRLPWEQCGC